MANKKCSICKKDKNVTEYHKDKQRSDGLRPSCKSCKKKQSQQYYVDNVEQLRNKSQQYKHDHKDVVSKGNRLYYLNNRTKVNSYMNIYLKNKRDTDPDFRLRTNLRARINKALRYNSKSISNIELLGCTIEELKVHLQKTAIKNGYKYFDINNYLGKDYHIDHIKPCASFNLTKLEEQRKCFNYSNLQILTATENLEKSDIYE